MEKQQSTLSLEVNLLGVPLYLLSNKRKQNIKMLSYEWKNADNETCLFQFERSEKVDFPLVEHANYFMCLMALFSQKSRINDEGVLWFSLAEIARFAGKSPDSQVVISAIKETIRRYSYTTAHWINSWKSKGFSADPNWHGPLIIAENIIVTTNHIDQTPPDQYRRYFIQFHPLIVKNLKDEFMRILIHEAVSHPKLSAASKGVYRYFFSFSDNGKVKRDISRLMDAFSWGGRKEAFRTWLEDKLSELSKHKYVESYSYSDSTRSEVLVKCRNIAAIKALTTRNRSDLLPSEITKTLSDTLSVKEKMSSSKKNKKNLN